jgi:D-glycero-alpha-D-manno-heptose-7-phosphate kinase
MISVRSPLRITLGGGGTDLSSYYRHHEGFVISAAIDKYIYLNIIKTFIEGIIIKYSKFESVKNIEDINHPIIREVLNYFDFKPPHQLEIISLADIPAGTGLGSSGSFTTAIIKALALLQKRQLSQFEIAELACYIEISKLKEPIGKQDQFISAFGGLTCFTFHKDDKVSVKTLDVSQDTFFDLQDNLMLFFTGFSRRASDILSNQNSQSENNNFEMINNLHGVKNLGYNVYDALVKGNTELFGELMREHWEFKKQRGQSISSSQIDEWYDLGIKNGAIGGKVVGAGGGGFLMFFAHDRNLLRKVMNKAGLQEMRFKFDFEGTKTLMIS